MWVFTFDYHEYFLYDLQIKQLDKDAQNYSKIVYLVISVNLDLPQNDYDQHH